MVSKTRFPQGDQRGQRDDDDAASTGHDAATGQEQACLKLIEHVRKRSASIDADWLFGADQAQRFTKTDAESAAAASDHKSGARPQRIGRFEIVRPLGRGGYGVVFLAIDPALNRQIALKVPAPDALLNGELQRRFLREAEAAAALNHPQIVTVYETGRLGTLHFIASEYVQGDTLAGWLKANGGRIDPASAADLIRALAKALQHAHSRGVLHRDIKPGNVLLESADGKSLAAAELAAAARLTDFGLARFQAARADSGDDVTRESIIGTPAYMSPEQADGRNGDVDATSDVYALGMILYELLVGETPFKRETNIATLKAIWDNQLVPPSRRAPNVPADLEAICVKCLQKDQSDRYPTADALAADLQTYLAGEPVAARQVTRLDRLGRWCRRNPVVATLLALVAVLTLVIAVGSTVAAIELSDSRQQALDHLEREIHARAEATKKEELAVRALFEARVAQARARRRSGAPGQQRESFEAVQNAAGLIAQLGLGEQETRLLRNEVIACLSLFDLEDDRQWPLNNDASTAHTSTARASTAHATDAGAERYACYEPKAEALVVRRLADNAVVVALPQDGRGVDISTIRFSPDGAYLACTWDRDGKLPRVEVWSLAQPKLVHRSIIPTTVRPFDFSPDGKCIAIGRRDGSVDLRELPACSVGKTIPGKDPATLIRFRPDGSQLCVCRSKQIELLDASTGRTIRSIERFGTASFTKYGSVNDVDWSKDGSLLAVAIHRSALLWRTSTGASYRLLNHNSGVTSVRFHPNGRVLATNCGGNTTRLWDINDGNPLLAVQGKSTEFSRDGLWLGKPAGRWRVVLPLAHRVFRQPRLPGSDISVAGSISVHKEGRLAAASNRAQTIFRDLATGQVVAAFEVTDGTGVFSPTGSDFVVSTVKELSRRPIVRRESAQEIHYRLGPSVRIGEGNCGTLAVSNDGKVISCVDRYHLCRVMLHHTVTRHSDVLAAHDGAKWLDLTRDGKWLATGSWRGKDVCVWDAQTGELVRSLPADSARVAFSPDGSMLAIDQGRRFGVWNLKDWTPIVRWRTRQRGNIQPGCLVFSPDGRILGVRDAENVIRLLDTTTFAELARFELPSGNIVEQLAFGPRGTRLLAGVRSSWGALHVWDLKRLRRQLSQMQLDWDHPRLPDRPDESKAVRVTLSGL